MKRDSDKTKAEVLTRVEKRPRGRPSKFVPEVVDRILTGLAQGTPLTIICEPEDMPNRDCVYEWMKEDEEFYRQIARAREAGFDRIALDAMAIADSSELDTVAFERAGQTVEIPDKEWILRTKLRVETRLKLLAKWDPKRYGDRIATEISGPDGKPIQSQSSHEISPEMQEAILSRASDAARIASGVSAPASFRGEESDK
jgi:hypothetical protein